MKTRFSKRAFVSVGLFLASALASTLLFTGCEIDSAETAARDVDIVVSGFYANPTTGAPVVQKNSGADITSLDLRQSGDQLEAIDNNGYIFKGTIGNVNGEVANITMSGLTTAGSEGTISGTIVVSGSSAVMQGTWIEDAFYSTVYATATVPTNTSSTSYTLSVSANPAAGGNVSGGGTYAAGQSATVQASANGGYTFSGWGGDLSGSANPTTITMNGNKSVVANFSGGSP